MTHLLEAQGLVKRYGARTVVDGVDVVVDAGEIVALIGPNGAGKTTTVEMMLGVRQPDGGTVTYALADARRGVGAQLQNTPFFSRPQHRGQPRAVCRFLRFAFVRS